MPRLSLTTHTRVKGAHSMWHPASSKNGDPNPSNKETGDANPTHRTSTSRRPDGPLFGDRMRTWSGCWNRRRRTLEWNGRQIRDQQRRSIVGQRRQRVGNRGRRQRHGRCGHGNGWGRNRHGGGCHGNRGRHHWIGWPWYGWYHHGNRRPCYRRHDPNRGRGWRHELDSGHAA